MPANKEREHVSAMQRGELTLFAMESSQAFGESVSQHLGVALSKHEERDFEDGEHKSRPLVNVRNRDVFVLASLYGDQQQTVNDKLCRLLFFLGALCDASANSVTVVVPYLCYARKDRKTKSRDPVTTRYIARLFESIGIDRLVTMDVHNLAAFQNAFDRPTDHLEAKRLFVEHFAPLAREHPLAVVSPDVGGVKRARAFQEALQGATGQAASSAFMDKQRSEGVVSGEAFVGDVSGRIALIIDDLISSGTTLARTAKACRERGAQRVLAAATHGVFARDAEKILSDPALDQIVVTNTIPPFRLSREFIDRKLTIIDVTPLVAATIRCIHEGGSVVELLEMGA